MLRCPTDLLKSTVSCLRRIRWPLMVVLPFMGIGLAPAQTVQLQGRLQDRYTAAPIRDAEVTLVLQGLKTRTDADGKFSISQLPTRLDGNRVAQARLARGGLAFLMLEPTWVTVRVVDAQGKHPMRRVRAYLGEGEWNFRPGSLPPGLHFLSLEAGGSPTVIRFPNLENSGSLMTGFQREADPGFPSLGKRAAVLDTLRFSKAGYLAGTMPLSSLTQTGIIAQVTDSGASQSRLTDLALANVQLQPAFQSDVMAYNAVVRESVKMLEFAFSTGIAEPELVILANGTNLSATSTSMPLHIGENTLEFQSTSQDGSSSIIYAIGIHRSLDTGCSLTELTVTGGLGALQPNFQSAVQAYKVRFATGATEGYLAARWGEPLASVRVNGALLGNGLLAHSATVSLTKDSTRATIEVTSPNGQKTSTYTVDFLRDPAPPPPPPPPSVAAGLASVKTSLNSVLFPEWSSATTGYRFDMLDTASILLVTYTPNNPEAFIKAGNNDWQQGTVVESLPFKGSPVYFNHQVVVRLGTDTVRYTFTITTVLSKDASMNRVTLTPRGFGEPFTDWPEWSVIFGENDSVVDFQPVTQSPKAKLTFEGKEIPYNTKIRIALKPGNNRFSMKVTSEEGSTTRSTTLYFGRLKPKIGVKPPVLAGPGRGYIDMPYAYTFTHSTDTCLIGMTLQSRITWGDGTSQNSGDLTNPLMPPFGTHIWKTPGTFEARAINYCRSNYLTLPGDTSVPVTVQISDTSNGGKVRTISGPRMVSETWSPDTLYKVTANTLFEPTTTLTILPGTKVLFLKPANPSASPYYIAIHGGFSAAGTATDSIYFEGTGFVNLKWQGPLTYNPDGSYKAGPRFEYVTFNPSSGIYLDETGGYGFYLKHSNLPLVTASTTKYARGSYIEKSRIGDLTSVMLDNSRILNSYIQSLSVNAASTASLVISQCDIKTINLGYYSSSSGLVQISPNTLGTVNGGWSVVELHGNNILGTPLGKGVQAYRSMGTSAVNLQDNYWGEAATTEMIAKGANQNISVIHDYFDDVATGKVDYSSWKTSAVSNAQPDW